MKLKLKHLAAVVGIFAVAGPAMAAITPPSPSGNSELFLVIWNDGAKASYTKDLGVRINEFTGEVGYNFALDDAIFTRFAGLAGGLAASQYAVIGGGDALSLRLFSTIDKSATPYERDQLQSGVDWLGSYIQNQILLPTADQTHTTLANGTSIATDPNPAYFNTLGNNGPGYQFSAVGWTNSVQVGTEGRFRQFSVTGFDDPTQTDFGTAVAGAYGAWNVLQSPTGQWSASYAVTAVPEPAGVMLMLAGLGALGLVARRRRQG